MSVESISATKPFGFGGTDLGHCLQLTLGEDE